MIYRSDVCGAIYNRAMPAFIAVCLILLAGFVLSVLVYLALSLVRWLQAGTELRQAEAARLRESNPPVA